ncbi:retrovirus-related pol polyprotein from transposon TNT 1-94 [Tanacetum coccineum]
MVYTPQHNAVVEIKHKHLLDTARALKFHAALLDKFWGDCTIGYLYYYATITKPHKDKFTPRSVRCVVIGYPLGQKGNILYNLDTRELWPNLETTKEDVVHDCLVQNNNEADANDHMSNTPDDRTIDEPEKHYAEVPGLILPQLLETSFPTMRSTKAFSQPAWLKDFVVAKCKDFMAAVVPKAVKQRVYPLFKDKDFDDYPRYYVASVTHVLASVEHVHYSQATVDSKWVEAMNKELQALETNDTWTLTTLLEGQKAISSKWVYKIKYLPNREVERYKARLVIRGFDQKEGLAYTHTFSPVAKADAVRVLIAIATAKGWSLHQLDVNNAFLHGYVEEDIYMNPPQGYTNAMKDKTANGTHLHQRKYLLDLLNDAGLAAATPTTFPLPQNL